ncbi:hypothetical protein V1515DRAFT_128029 [Lipomyces mesembrius]
MTQVTSVSVYIADCTSVIAELDWDDAADRDQFYSGLKKHVKDRKGGEANGTGATIRLGPANRFAVHGKGNGDRNLGNSNRQFRCAMSPTNQEKPATPCSNSGPGPMQLDALIGDVAGAQGARLRKERTRLGLCWQCGEKGNLHRDRPRDLNSQAKNAGRQ